MEKSGLLLVDKPSGPTSHDAVLWARRVLRQKKIGHCGTLDSLASGLLILAMGRALKWQDRLMKERKLYQGRFRLGISTETDDITGRVIADNSSSPTLGEITEEHLREAARGFLGPQLQRVPRYSAAKVRGRRLYEWAREGVHLPLPVKPVEIYRFDLLSFAPPEVEFRVECSKGTYVRALARDLGEKLRVGATLAALCRECIGPFSRTDALAWSGDAAGPLAPLEKCFIPFSALENTHV